MRVFTQLVSITDSCSSLLLWTPEMSSGMCRWRKHCRWRAGPARKADLSWKLEISNNQSKILGRLQCRQSGQCASTGPFWFNFIADGLDDWLEQLPQYGSVQLVSSSLSADGDRQTYCTATSHWLLLLLLLLRRRRRRSASKHRAGPTRTPRSACTAPPAASSILIRSVVRSDPTISSTSRITATVRRDRALSPCSRATSSSRIHSEVSHRLLYADTIYGRRRAPAMAHPKFWLVRPRCYRPHQ